MSSFIYTSLVAVIFAIAFIGWKYVRLANNAKRQKESKRLYVKKNMDQFGANNRGTSMDKQKIFVVSPSDLGI